MKLAKCPYCGRRLSYPSAFMYKSKGEYTCTRCKKKSNVSIDKKMWLLFILVFLIALVSTILIVMYIAAEAYASFLLVMIPFFIFYLLVPFFVKLRPLKKYREFVTQQQKYSAKQDIIAPITESNYVTDEPMINTDVFNQIKAKRKIITEEESARTKAFNEGEEFNKVSTDTISRNLLRDKTASFDFKTRDNSQRRPRTNRQSRNYDDFLSDD